MQLEFIKDKVYYKIFDLTYTGSTGIYARNNIADASKLAEVNKNIANIKNEFNVKDLFILKQVHGNKIVSLDIDDYKDRPEADASITTQKNKALAILTADCVPVLFASEAGDLIAAAHCGWKSAKENIIKNVVLEMKSHGAKKIKAIIGPSIAQESYEVDENYYNNFISESKDNDQFFIPSNKQNHYLFSLSDYVKNKLYEEDIELMHHINEDTYSMEYKYPSFRRCTHTGTKYTHNILSTIVIRDNV